MFGYSLPELLEVPPIQMLAPEQRPLVIQIFAGFRAGQEVPPVLEFSAIHKDGSRIEIEATVGHVRISDGVAYALVMRDSRNQSQLSLLEADRIGLVGALSAGFAHEINNPLTPVLLNLRSLRRQLTTHLPPAAQAQALRCLDDVTVGAERIASNVRALQTLATRSATQPIDLAAVVSASLRLAAPSLNRRAHVIRQISPVRPVIGEEARIGQAVLAMMLFSISGFDPEATNTANRIIVSVEERAPAVVVEVTDNGRELPAEEARRAFDPFFRSRTRGAGVGVGLGVARSVAATLGGEVTLAPRPGGGAVITMRLPAAAVDTSGT
jgi:two-component system C4-dicarboxylate transport sensor histidine kinase DctB